MICSELLPLIKGCGLKNVNHARTHARELRFSFSFFSTAATKKEAAAAIKHKSIEFALHLYKERESTQATTGPVAFTFKQRRRRKRWSGGLFIQTGLEISGERVLNL